jgi:hypothetical protein
MVSWITTAAGALGYGITALFAEATFSSTIGLGSVIVAMLVVVLYGAFSLKQKQNNGWKDLYEQEYEKCKNLNEKLAAEQADRHDIKDELAGTKALLLVEQAKPNLQLILEEQRNLWAEAMAPLMAALERVSATQEHMLALLTEREVTGQ